MTISGNQYSNALFAFFAAMAWLPMHPEGFAGKWVVYTLYYMFCEHCNTFWFITLQKLRQGFLPLFCGVFIHTFTITTHIFIRNIRMFPKLIKLPI